MSYENLKTRATEFLNVSDALKMFHVHIAEKELHSAFRTFLILHDCMHDLKSFYLRQTCGGDNMGEDFFKDFGYLEKEYNKAYETMLVYIPLPQ